MAHTHCEWGGTKARRHASYIIPRINCLESLHLYSSFLHYPKGTPITALSYKEVNRQYFWFCRFPDSQEHIIKQSIITKPVVGKDLGKNGREYELRVQREFFEDGMCSLSDATAGASAHGTDLILDVANLRIGVEIKESMVKGKCGAIATAYYDEKWDASTHWQTRRKPHYISALQNLKIDGMTVFDHMLERWGPYDKKNPRELPGFTLHIKSSELAHAYCMDKKVDILMIGGYGMYRVGLSHDHDRFNLGLPTIESMEGTLTVGRADGAASSPSIIFRPNRLDRSHMDHTLQEHRLLLRKRMETSSGV